MSLPVVLSKGIVSLYHLRSTGINGIHAPDNYNFGVINQVWHNNAFPPYIGDSVMFDGREIIKLTYAGTVYNLIDEDKIKLIETAAP